MMSSQSNVLNVYLDAATHAWGKICMTYSHLSLSGQRISAHLCKKEFGIKI